MTDDSLLTGPPLTANYEPPYQSWAGFAYDPNRPIFTHMAIEPMLCDPRVRFGMALRRGPIISNSRFFINTQNPELKEFVAAQINRFWQTSIKLALRSTEYGRQPAEILYRATSQGPQFDKLTYIHPDDALPRVSSSTGIYLGADIRGINRASSAGESTGPGFVAASRMLWTVFQRDRHKLFGESLLKGPFMPWYEKWARRGYRDQRQLFFFKYAFQGPIVYHPSGHEAPDASLPPGSLGTSRRALAQQVGDRYATGASITLPGDTNATGTARQWEIVPPQSLDAPASFMEYGYSLDDEILEGCEVPPEVARAARGGSGGISIGGQGGRDIPMQAYYSILSEQCREVISDFDEQILARELVPRRFGHGRMAEYEIECYGLLRGDENPSGQPNNAAEQTQADPLIDDNGGTGDGRPQEAVALSSYEAPALFFPSRGEEKDAREYYRRKSVWGFSVKRSA